MANGSVGASLGRPCRSPTSDSPLAHPRSRPTPEAEGLPTGWRAVVPDLRPLRRHRDYRLLTLGQSVSFFGSMVTYVAVPYQVYELTDSSLAVGMVGVVQMAAILALAFLGGALADAADRRRLVRLAEAGELACCWPSSVNASLDRPPVWPVFVLAGAHGRASTPSSGRPSRGSSPASSTGTS